jgi:hypothetical protein
MSSGYGNDTTAQDVSSSDAASIASSIAQIFSTGVTAYTDSQAIQRGYQINDPRYYQSGYPGGVGTPYGATPAGAGVAVTASSQKTLLFVVVVAAVLFLAFRK